MYTELIKTVFEKLTNGSIIFRCLIGLIFIHVSFNYIKPVLEGHSDFYYNCLGFSIGAFVAFLIEKFPKWLCSKCIGYIKKIKSTHISKIKELENNKKLKGEFCSFIRYANIGVMRILTLTYLHDELIVDIYYHSLNYGNFNMNINPDDNYMLVEKGYLIKKTDASNGAIIVELNNLITEEVEKLVLEHISYEMGDPHGLLFGYREIIENVVTKIANTESSSIELSSNEERNLNILMGNKLFFLSIDRISKKLHFKSNKHKKIIESLIEMDIKHIEYSYTLSE